ncbi:MAG: SIMPL domain-containing protein [Methanotrichaceae archaeon]
MKEFCILLLGSVLLMAMAFPGSAADINNASKITVQGQGNVYAAPDQAIIVLGVETRNTSASVAAAQNAELMNKTVNALLTAGINKSNIQTSTYSLSIPTENDQIATAQTGNTTKPPEFVATNQVTVTTNNTQGVGRILDAAIASGSNSVQSISFQLKDSNPQMDKALTLAIEDAQRKAQVMAKAAGVKLGRVLEISSGYSYAAPTARYDVLSAAASTPVLPGQMEVTASISMTYEIS